MSFLINDNEEEKLFKITPNSSSPPMNPVELPLPQHFRGLLLRSARANIAWVTPSFCTPTDLHALKKRQSLPTVPWPWTESALVHLHPLPFTAVHSYRQLFSRKREMLYSAWGWGKREVINDSVCFFHNLILLVGNAYIWIKHSPCPITNSLLV